MTEGVSDLPMAVSPERIPKRVQHLGARSLRMFPQSIYVLDVKVQNGGSAAQSQRRHVSLSGARRRNLKAEPDVIAGCNAQLVVSGLAALAAALPRLRRWSTRRW